MREYFKINPLPRNFDSVYELLVESDILASETTVRCKVEFNLMNRNLQVILSSITSNDVDFCSSESVRIAAVFNSPNQYISFLPDVLQFSSAAVAVDQIQLVEDLITVTVNGATSVSDVTVTIVVYAVITAIASLQ